MRRYSFLTVRAEEITANAVFVELQKPCQLSLQPRQRRRGHPTLEDAAQSGITKVFQTAENFAAAFVIRNIIGYDDKHKWFAHCARSMADGSLAVLALWLITLPEAISSWLSAISYRNATARYGFDDNTTCVGATGGVS
jgi:hypothetical protein